jgi:sulfide dehydrogenase cytochrome subunit
MAQVSLLLALALAVGVHAPASAQMPVAAPAPPGASSCGGCHAPPGVGTAVPPLHGRSAADIVKLMAAFRGGEQPATVMDRIAKGFSEAETEAIAEWYARQK